MVESKKTQAKILAFLLVLALFVVKVFVTGVHHWSLIDAIYVYQTDCMAVGKDAEVWQTDKEEFDDTLWRLWDWSDKRILSEEHYRKVKPYIGMKVDYTVMQGNWR